MDSQTWSLLFPATGFGLSAFLAWLLFHERKKQAAATAEVRRLAFHDPLTGLPNRLLFMDRAAIALANARRSGTKVAVAYVDLDRFKLINDSYGHGVGDDVLREVATRLRDQLREVDTVARMGGDEFTLIMPGLHGMDDIVKVGSKVLDVFHVPLRVGMREIVSSASVGIAVFPDDGGEAETLLKRADSAMYDVKGRGGDDFKLHTASMNDDAREEMELETRLRLAVARQEFVLYYQPRVGAEGSRVVAFEALLRWNDPARGIIMPREFIHVAEVSGLIVPMGRWALRAACRQAAEWHAQGSEEMVISVNLSARQFHWSALTATIREALRDAALEPRYLELEVDETCVMANAETSMRILAELKGLGVRVLIAHFGAGYSSLSYLRRFPIDGLKLDRSFFAGGAGQEDRALATAAVGMAKALSLKVFGEGVETQDSADFLRAQQCDGMQGFLVSEAVPAEECNRFIHRVPAVPPLLDATRPPE